MTDYAHNGYANDLRHKKATALARALYAELTPKRRNAISREAGVRPGSVETWALATRLLSDRFAWDARHPEGDSK